MAPHGLLPSGKMNHLWAHRIAAVGLILLAGGLSAVENSPGPVVGLLLGILAMELTAQAGDEPDR